MPIPGRWLAAAVAAALLPRPAAAAGAAAVRLRPSDDVAAAVAAAPAGSRFRFDAGIYRLAEIVPKDGDSFVGAPGAVLSGAQLVSGFARRGRFAVAPTNVQPRAPSGACAAGRLCDRPNDVFVDGLRQEPVLQLSRLAPGRFLIDYRAHLLYLGSDPAGKTVELGTVRYAFAGPAANVRISGLVVEKYANEAQSGAIVGDGRPVHWTIENCEIRFNHGGGIQIGSDSRIAHSFIHDNGQLGIGGGGSHLVVEDNEIAANNQAGYNSSWEAGGLKFAVTIYALIRGNYVHDNHGPGLWTDIDAVDTVYDGNRVENNDGAGIQHEISYDAVIRNNRLRGNGRTSSGWGWGAQILVQNSRDVEVRGNSVVVPDGGNGIILIEQRRKPGDFGPHLIRDCTIVDNKIDMAGSSGIAAGMMTDYAAGGLADGGNRFDGDTYRVPDAGGRFWAWPSWQGNVDFPTFQRRYGQETAGRIIVGPPP